VIWVVKLLGDEVDLGALSESLAEGSVRISHKDGEYLLSADVLVGEDAEAVFGKAHELLAVLNGGLRLTFNSRRPITSGGIFRIDDDGKRHYTLVLEPLALHVRVMPATFSIKHNDGTETRWRASDVIRTWSELATGDEAVAHVLRAFAGETGWFSLYSLLDTIAKDVGGWDQLPAREWITNDAMRLFKNTANSYAAVGVEARHGVGKVAPPAHPMRLGEARSLAEAVVHAWLRYKVTAHEP
jgi:hypothetical protein